MIDNLLSTRGQAHARRALVEKLVAEQKLQPLDLRADRGLGDAERLRRFGKAALIDDEHECPQKFSWDIDHAPSPFLRVRAPPCPRGRPPPTPFGPAADLIIAPRGMCAQLPLSQAQQ